MRWTLRIVGGIMVALGSVWTLQGFDVMKNSPMSGSSFWLTAGVILALAGVVVLFFGLRAGVRRGR